MSPECQRNLSLVDGFDGFPAAGLYGWPGRLLDDMDFEGGIASSRVIRPAVLVFGGAPGGRGCRRAA
jgi:hypothetical protein